MEAVISYPYFNCDYKVTISGPENKVYYVLKKLEYMALNELNDDDLDGITSEESYE